MRTFRPTSSKGQKFDDYYRGLEKASRRVPKAVKLLRDDQDTAQYALQEVQDVLKDMNGFLDL